MFGDQKLFSLKGIILFTVILCNAIIITAGFNYNQDLYWGLLISAPLVLFALYYKKQKPFLLPGNKVRDIQFSSKLNEFKSPVRLVCESELNTMDVTVLIGNHQCSQPYNPAIVSIGSYYNGSNDITKNAIQLSSMFAFRNLNESEKASDDLNKADDILQVDACNIGQGKEKWNFKAESFRINAGSPEVKMIVLKLSEDINKANNKKLQEPSAGCMETAFITAEGMVLFLEELRKLSGKKPVGISLSISNEKEFYEICFAIRKTEIIPDFIIIEGSQNNENGPSIGREDNTSLHLYDALLFVSKTLERYGLSKDIKIIPSASIYSGFDVLKLISLGADAICVKYSRFQINQFKAKNSVQGPSLIHTLYSLHYELMRNTIAIMNICRFKKTGDVTLSSLFQCMNISDSKLFNEMPPLKGKKIIKLNETMLAMPVKSTRHGKRIAI